MKRVVLSSSLCRIVAFYLLFLSDSALTFFSFDFLFDFAFFKNDFTSFLKVSISDDIEGDTLYNPRMCPICCEEYEKGDDIAWSKNEDCVHAYHTDCIVPWLLEHSDCPMCRNDYLCLEES